MTTKEDWQFRAEYLRDNAKFLRSQAESYKALAVKYDKAAKQAQHELDNFEKEYRED